MSKRIKISNKAADCLAFFIGHPYYGDDLSEVIVNLTEEWFMREGKDMDWVKGCFEEECNADIQGS